MMTARAHVHLWDDPQVRAVVHGREVFVTVACPGVVMVAADSPADLSARHVADVVIHLTLEDAERIIAAIPAAIDAAVSDEEAARSVVLHEIRERRALLEAHRPVEVAS